MPRFRLLWILLPGLALALISCNNTSQNGRPAPEMNGEDANGVPLRLRDYRGKVVLLDFWATN